MTRIRNPALKNRLIDLVIERFGVDLSEAEQRNPHLYRDFNHFFTRALQPGARPLAEGEATISSPVDGTISQLGAFSAGSILQAKGHDYSLAALLGDEQRAAPFAGGQFATIYLSPRDYHRIHMPLDGSLREMVHIPGRLFSVSPATTRVIPGLFARNERVISLFDTAIGPLAVIKVGAVFVGSIETVWAGVVTPPAGRIVRRWRYEDDDRVELARGEEMGRFNMGSTVILLFAPQAMSWSTQLNAETTVRMGQALGQAHAAGSGEAVVQAAAQDDSQTKLE